MAWSPTTPQTYSSVSLDIGTKSFNHAPHQWCSGPRMMTQVWMWYPTIFWVFDEAWTTSDRQTMVWSPTTPQIWSPVTLVFGTMGLNHVPWWCRYVYHISLFYECDMRHGPCLTGVGHATYHCITSNYIPTCSDETLLVVLKRLNSVPSSVL